MYGEFLIVFVVLPLPAFPTIGNGFNPALFEDCLSTNNLLKETRPRHFPWFICVQNQFQPSGVELPSALVTNSLDIGADSLTFKKNMPMDNVLNTDLNRHEFIPPWIQYMVTENGLRRKRAAEISSQRAGAHRWVLKSFQGPQGGDYDLKPIITQRYRASSLIDHRTKSDPEPDFGLVPGTVETLSGRNETTKSVTVINPSSQVGITRFSQMFPRPFRGSLHRTTSKDWINRRKKRQADSSGWHRFDLPFKKTFVDRTTGDQISVSVNGFKGPINHDDFNRKPVIRFPFRKSIVDPRTRIQKTYIPLELLNEPAPIIRHTFPPSIVDPRTVFTTPYPFDVISEPAPIIHRTFPPSIVDPRTFTPAAPFDMLNEHAPIIKHHFQPSNLTDLRTARQQLKHSIKGKVVKPWTKWILPESHSDYKVTEEFIDPRTIARENKLR